MQGSAGSKISGGCSIHEFLNVRGQFQEFPDFRGFQESGVSELPGVSFRIAAGHYQELQQLQALHNIGNFTSFRKNRYFQHSGVSELPGSGLQICRGFRSQELHNFPGSV